MNNHPHAPSVALLLYGVNVLTVAAGFGILVWWGTASMRSVAERQLERDEAAAARTIASLFEQDNKLEDIARRVREVSRNTLFPDTDELRITIVARDGTVAADTATNSQLENHLDRDEIAAVFNGEDGFCDIRRSTVSGDDVMYYAVPIMAEGEMYALRLSSPIRRTVYVARRSRMAMAAAGAAVLIAVLILTTAASVFIVHGINALRGRASQMRQGNFDSSSGKANDGDGTSRIVYAPREVLLLRDDIETMAQEVKRLEEVRKDFVANVSHELKTPVTAIIGFSETLLDMAEDTGGNSGTGGDDTEHYTMSDAVHFLKIINSQGKRLVAIIEDLLTLSRLERDSRKPEMMRCDMEALTRRVAGSFADRASERGMHLLFYPCSPSSASNAKGIPCADDTYHSAGGGSVFCMVNERLYEEALGNIIDNAIKYCPSGAHIDCRVECDGNRDGKGVVRIVVEDDGAGIPEQLRDRVFERFFRVDKGRSRDMGGTGLGLSIASHIVKAHGGTLRATSRADGKSGAVFIIDLARV